MIFFSSAAVHVSPCARDNTTCCMMLRASPRRVRCAVMFAGCMLHRFTLHPSACRTVAVASRILHLECYIMLHRHKHWQPSSLHGSTNLEAVVVGARMRPMGPVGGRCPRARRLARAARRVRRGWAVVAVAFCNTQHARCNIRILQRAARKRRARALCVQRDTWRATSSTSCGARAAARTAQRAAGGEQRPQL